MFCFWTPTSDSIALWWSSEKAPLNRTTVLSVASGDSIVSVCPVFWLPSLFAPISMQYRVPMVTGIPGWPHLTTRSPWVIVVASHCPCLMHTHTHTFSYYFLRCHGVTSLLITALISCSNSAMCQLLAKCAPTIAQVGHFFRSCAKAKFVSPSLSHNISLVCFTSVALLVDRVPSTFVGDSRD